MSTISLSQLKRKLRSKYTGEVEITIQYEDDENDIITIRTNEDLEQAFELFYETEQSTLNLLIYTKILNKNTGGFLTGKKYQSDKNEMFQFLSLY